MLGNFVSAFNRGNWKLRTRLSGRHKRDGLPNSVLVGPELDAVPDAEIEEMYT
jgi:hypothetical protein